MSPDPIRNKVVLREVSRLVGRAMTLCDASLGALTWCVEGTEIEVVVARGGERSIRGRRLPLLQTPSGMAITTGRTISSEDATNDRRRRLHRLAELPGARAVLITPIGSVATRRGALLVGQPVPWSFGAHDGLALRLCAQAVDLLTEVTRASGEQHWAMQRIPVATPRMLVQTLTGRERQIADRLLQGLSVKEVAAQLHLSPRTVEHAIERLKIRYRQGRLHGLTAHLARCGGVEEGGGDRHGRRIPQRRAEGE